jgi:SAM-dependent methyltransferase
VAATFAAMVDTGELREGTLHTAAVQGDALHLPFHDATFDRVICSEVLEHIANDVAAMAELARVLRPGGTMAITVPRFGPELINWALSDEYHNVPGGHIRIYRRSVLSDRLRSVGLRVTGHHYAHGLHSPYWWLKCLVGTTNDDHKYVKAYHRLLVWDIMKAPRTTRFAEKVLAPMIGKSIIVYLVKPIG